MAVCATRWVRACDPPAPPSNAQVGSPSPPSKVFVSPARPETERGRRGGPARRVEKKKVASHRAQLAQAARHGRGPSTLRCSERGGAQWPRPAAGIFPPRSSQPRKRSCAREAAPSSALRACGGVHHILEHRSLRDVGLLTDAPNSLQSIPKSYYRTRIGVPRREGRLSSPPQRPCSNYASGF